MARRTYFQSDGWLICNECNHPLHNRWRYFRGWLAWYFVCVPWMRLSRHWSVPPLLAYAGDCIFDCRSCHHG